LAEIESKALESAAGNNAIEIAVSTYFENLKTAYSEGQEDFISTYEESAT
jgi:hypothetical protein